MENTVEVSNSQITQDERTHFRLWLQRQFTQRCKKNSRYSLRAFAKSLKLDPSTLSQILSGKRLLSKKSMMSLCEKLGASPSELSIFGLTLKVQSVSEDYFQVGLDTFAVISDWYHFAILELTFVKDFKSDMKWIARKLSITVEEAKSATERLMRLGLLTEQEGRLVKANKMITNQSAVNTSAAHKELQRQVLQKALSAIDECPAEQKDITSMTMAIDISKLDQARALTKKYRRDVSALLETSEQTQVYHLGIQLYPVSKSKESL